MGTTSELLLDTVVTLLTTTVQAGPRTVYPTAAGPRVYAPRDWPTVSGDYPAILASVPRETKEGVGRAQPNFTTTSIIRLLVRVDAPADANDGSAGPVQAKLWMIQRQIERTLIGAPQLMRLIQQVAGVHSELGFNSGGESHLGELGMELELEFFQDPWSFYIPDGELVGEVVVATVAADLAPSNPAGAHTAPGLDLKLTP